MSAIINRSATLHTGRVFSLVNENYTLENGVTADMDFIQHPGAAAMVPMLNEQEVVLIKQYRHAIREFIWEIPAGTLDAGESPLNCARRELVEETGYSANDWNQLGTITPLPGCSNERIHIFLASDLKKAEQQLDPDEMLNVHPIKLNDALQMILAGEISDGKTISGLFLASDLKKAEQQLDPDEMLNVHPTKLNDALQMILTGEISDGKTISGLFLASEWLNRKGS